MQVWRRGMPRRSVLYGVFLSWLWVGAAQAQEPAATAGIGGESGATPGGASPTALVEISEIPIERMLRSEMAGGTTGSFGLRLERYGISTSLHAYVVAEFDAETGAQATFDLHYFNVFVGANIRDVVIPEVQLEYEHGGAEIQIRYGQIDVRVFGERLVVRAGKFLVPMGVFNSFLYPEFISKLPDRPFVLREIVPVSWPEVGIQMRGRYEWREGSAIGYALYLVNGLEQADDLMTPGADEGGAIRDMRNNVIDGHHSDKAFGFRLGIEPTPGLTFGVSGYSGAYTVDGARRLSIGDVDVGLRRGNLTVRGELVGAIQEIAGTSLTKRGFYVIASYRLFGFVEPVLEFDAIWLDGAAADDRMRATAGLILYPFPDKVPTFVLKQSYAATWDRAGDPISHRYVAQLAIGF